MPCRVDIKIMLIKYLKKIDYMKNISKLFQILYEYRERIVVTLFMILFTILLAILTDKKISNENINMNLYDGKTFVTETYPIFKDVVFVGDSYSHFLALELGFDTTIYSSPGLPLEKLTYCFNSAKKNMKKYIVVFIGPNDYMVNTDLKKFNKLLSNYVKLFINDSKVILCSYLPSMYTDDIKRKGVAKYNISDYDDEIRKVANSYNKVYYFDLSDFIGKKEYYKYLVDELDTIHFNHKFYVEFINKLNSFIMSIK